MQAFFFLIHLISMNRNKFLETKCELLDAELKMYQKRYGKIHNITDEERVTLSLLGQKTW